jgi:hypothetical protein
MAPPESWAITVGSVSSHASSSSATGPSRFHRTVPAALEWVFDSSQSPVMPG